MGCKGSRVRIPPPRPLPAEVAGALIANSRDRLFLFGFMRILVSNDDGYFAPGLAALAEAVKPFGTVTVVAPEQNSSGASNSLTLSRPLTVSTAPNGYTYINGTPSDCVHIALTGLLEQRPDLIVSGINNGQNMGDDTIYSGTVAAAMEGYLFGVPSFAFSLVERGQEHVHDAAHWAAHI